MILRDLPAKLLPTSPLPPAEFAETWLLDSEELTRFCLAPE